MQPVIQFNNVSKQYRLGLTRTSLPQVLSNLLHRIKGRGSTLSQKQHLWALQNVTFELHQGKSLALVGPNGAGKSTILKLLANITKPTSGNIKIYGRLSALIELGSGFHPDLTGRENIFLNGTILGLTRSEIARRYDEIVAFSELEQFLDTPIKRYSSGMTVRLGFAVASCMEPDILLVDEVLAVGDASFRQKCMKRIQTLLESGTSTIFVSHNLWMVQAVCESAIYLEHGQIVKQGTTSDVLDVYDRAVNEARAQKLEVAQTIPQNSGPIEVEITEVEVLNAVGQPISELRTDEAAELQVHYITYADVESVNVVIRLLRSDGLTCCMMRTNLDGVSISLQKGSGHVSVVLEPVQLYGGSYHVQAIIRDATDTNSLAHKTSAWFYVKGTSPLSHQTMNGVFEPNRQWRHQPSRPSDASIEDAVGTLEVIQNGHRIDDASERVEI